MGKNKNRPIDFEKRAKYIYAGFKVINDRKCWVSSYPTWDLLDNRSKDEWITIVKNAHELMRLPDDEPEPVPLYQRSRFGGTIVS
jgi:hypothetical protein